MTTARAADAPPLIQSVDRAVDVLEYLAERDDGSVTDLAVALGVHKSTAFRLLAALESRGLVEQVTERGRYRLGIGLVRLAGAAASRIDLIEQARPVMRRLAAAIGETVNLARLEGGAVVNVDQVLGGATVATHNWVGQRTPLHATSNGKVLLAALDPEQRADFLRRPLEALTPATITDRAELEAELARAAATGWSSTREELEVGLNAIAAPVRSRDGSVIAAVSLSGPSYRLGPDRFESVAAAVIAAGEEISRRIGWRG